MGESAIITSAHDNSVGSTIAQSSGDPASNQAGLPALYFPAGTPAVELKHVRLSYLFVGLFIANGNVPNSAWHSQFFACMNAFACDTSNVEAYNVLFDHVDNPFQGGNAGIYAEHITVRNAADLGYDWGGPFISSIVIHNSLLVAVPICSMWETFWPPGVWHTSDAPAVFQASVLGGNYLAANSPYRGIGSANIHPKLRQGLKNTTTHPPLTLPATSSGVMILGPSVPRNEGIQPDIGYSYDAVDYVAPQGLFLQSGTLVATNGVMIGLNAGALTSGIRLAPGAKVISEGTPLKMNRFVEVRSVQEQHGSTIMGFNTFQQDFAESVPSELHLRFTELPWRAGLTWHLNRGGGVGVISLKDCQVYGGGFYANAGGNYEYTFALTNNLFLGAQFTVSGGTGTRIQLWNNSFIGGAMTLYGPNFTWTARDNLFQQVTLHNPGSFDNDYNAYYQTTPLSTGSGNLMLGGPVDFRLGSLGKWYLPAGSTPLLNGGSRSPAAGGLFHHTTQVGQQKEGSKPAGVNADIGFHYVAVEAENLSVRRYATQSSTQSGRSADRAVDGNTDGNAANGSVSETQTPGPQWWHLDLGASREIETLRIWNRTDCCAEQLRVMEMFVSDEPFPSVYPPILNNTPGVSRYEAYDTILRPSSFLIGRSGRYIFFHKGSYALAMAEVEVLGPTRAIDTEGDGLPDYFEDRNGNGNVDAAESDFKGPVVTFTTPADAFVISTTRMNMRGTVSHLSAPLKRVTVNGIRAFLTGNTFDVLNVPLSLGGNQIVATVEDINGNRGSAAICVHATGTLADPVVISATPGAGFDPLNVTFHVTSAAPGTFLDVQYDFNGDGMYESTRTTLDAEAHSYSAGEYLPVATVRTTLGHFSSLGGYRFSPDQNRLRICVAAPAVQQGSPLSVTDPVDLKCTSAGKLYVLSRTTATVVEYDSAHTIIRSFAGIGANSFPTGLDVDKDGRIYIALSGHNQVIRLRPTSTSFETDPNFNGNGRIGKADHAAGSAPGEFNTPFDVAVTPDGGAIYVTDSGNHRVQKFAASGTYVGSFGKFGTAFGELNTPKGVTFGDSTTLYVIDSGNSRLALARGENIAEVFGGLGAGPAELQSAQNLDVGSNGLYVAEPNQDQIKKFDRDGLRQSDRNRLEFLWAAGTGLGLLNPVAVAAGKSLTEERIYVADSGNNRVVLITLPSAPASGAWSSMVTKLTTNDREGALSHFSATSVDRYRQAFRDISDAELTQMITQVGAISPVYIQSGIAEYAFQQEVFGLMLTFPITFVWEEGAWKILDF